MHTNEAETLKNIVKEKYGVIAEQSLEQNKSSCCGSGDCCSSDFDVMAEDYSTVKGYVRDADLGLGCGIPTQFAHIRHGDTVVDLGSGAGNDCFVARSIVGESGKVIGIDMTEMMIAKANANKAKLGFTNIDFRLGDIEAIPIESNTADVIVSNCVLNLVPDKQKAFAEMFRVLKPGGHFTVSDIVLQGNLPEALQREAVMYVGCVAGAIQKTEYLQLIRQSGFQNVSVPKDREIVLPNQLLIQYLSLAELRELKKTDFGIFSITVYGEKPKT